MTALATTISILTCRNDISVHDSGCNSISLCENSKLATESYAAEKKNYFRTWEAHTENTSKVKEGLKELEHLFLNHQCVHLRWELRKPLLLFFSSGTVANISLNENKTKIEKVLFDNSLCGKLPSDHLTDVIVNESCLVISYSEPKLTYIHFGKQASLFAHRLLGSRRGKIIGIEPQIITVDLLLPSGRRLDKKLSLNCVKDCMLVWWRFSSSDIWPWMPVTQSIDRVSLLVYALNGNSVEILCSAKTQGELQYASFSRWHSNQINTLEQVSAEGKCDLNICSYEVTSGACQCTSLVKLPLQGRLTAFAWNQAEDKLLISDEEMSLLVYDLNNNTTLMTSTSFVVHSISWHPGGALVAVASTHGTLQCFDPALNAIKFQSFDKSTVPLSSLCLRASSAHLLQAARIIWQDVNYKHSALSSNEVSDTILMYFASGILAFFKFSLGCITRHAISPLELVSQYLKCGAIDESVCLLQNLDWCQHPELCFQCLTKICNCLLRKPLCLKTETALEHSLGTFYNSLNILPEAIAYDYSPQVDHIARRFFHHLLRFFRFEKAYLLAVELQSRDLFLDIHHVAKQKCELALAETAYKHAEQLDSPHSSSCEQSESGSISSEEIRTVQRTSMFLNDRGSIEEVLKQFPINTKPKLTSRNPHVQSMVGRKNWNKEPLLNQVYKSIDCESNVSTSGKSENMSNCDSLFIPLQPNSDKKHKLSHVYSNPLSHSNNSSSHAGFLFHENRDLNEILDEEEEEEDMEGVRIKFSHFGVV